MGHQWQYAILIDEDKKGLAFVVCGGGKRETNRGWVV